LVCAADAAEILNPIKIDAHCTLGDRMISDVQYVTGERLITNTGGSPSPRFFNHVPDRRASHPRWVQNWGQQGVLAIKMVEKVGLSVKLPGINTLSPLAESPVLTSSCMPHVADAYVATA
jgi:hypothetical protein